MSVLTPLITGSLLLCHLSPVLISAASSSPTDVFWWSRCPVMEWNTSLFMLLTPSNLTKWFLSMGKEIPLTWGKEKFLFTSPAMAPNNFFHQVLPSSYWQDLIGVWVWAGKAQEGRAGPLNWCLSVSLSVDMLLSNNSLKLEMGCLAFFVLNLESLTLTWFSLTFALVAGVLN